ncbi:hypothetical protein HYH02_005853 [Chlamydomonas schloesseri]|uniref:YdbS-like PH domain-containing protein n=1 Tax=Chlamydomonas schloesseri TaxID=2026947 RepID=A0A836B6N5_9CHLO|nr:hypothetical protein HYH02_005853 [Chlamydomonas schloesseri]|eukprot:KAG2449105.1 hypothetical protein HYH02_005853 [Chlamydomonas schloesseri]
MAPYHTLTLERDTLKVKWAINDCCFHIAHNSKAVPLEKIQDVQLSEDCCLTMFSLKQVNVETAAGAGREVEAAFCAEPEKVRDAIQLAARLHKAAMSAPGAVAGMTRAGGLGGAAGPGGGGTIAARVAAMEGLVRRGALSPDEVARIRVPVLAAEADPLPRLVDAANAMDQAIITPNEFAQIKTKIIAQIQD